MALRTENPRRPIPSDWSSGFPVPHIPLKINRNRGLGPLSCKPCSSRAPTIKNPEREAAATLPTDPRHGSGCALMPRTRWARHRSGAAETAGPLEDPDGQTGPDSVARMVPNAEIPFPGLDRISSFSRSLLEDRTHPERHGIFQPMSPHLHQDDIFSPFSGKPPGFPFHLLRERVQVSCSGRTR